MGPLISKSRIFIFGAASSGTSTLGRALANELGLAWLDTDDIFWEPTDPPFRIKREIDARQTLLVTSLTRAQDWVLSGSLCGWGDVVIPSIELAVYLHTPTAIRTARLREREHARFGPRVLPGGDMHEQHEAFLTWAASYDDAPPEGRSRLKHAQWSQKLTCPVMRVDGAAPINEMCRRVIGGPHV